MAYPSGKLLLRADGSISLDANGRRILASGDDDCDCCGDQCGDGICDETTTYTLTFVEAFGDLSSCGALGPGTEAEGIPPINLSSGCFYATPASPEGGGQFTVGGYALQSITLEPFEVSEGCFKWKVTATWFDGPTATYLKNGPNGASAIGTYTKQAGSCAAAPDHLVIT